MARAFGQNVCTDFEQAASMEWLETNGLGGYASSSIVLCNTRRYHGLLVAAVRPPVGRQVLLAKLDAAVRHRGGHLELGTNQWPGTIHPTGYRHIVSFTNEPWPTWVYGAAGWRLRQEILMPDGQNATLVRWTLLHSDDPLHLEIRPKVTSRDLHCLGRRGDLPEPVLRPQAGGFRVDWGDGRCGLTIAHDGQFSPEPDWYYDYVYERDRARGFDYQEDLFRPGAIHCDLRQGEPATIIASLDRLAWDSVDSLMNRERARRREHGLGLLRDDPYALELARAARHFLVRRGREWTILAGYPWFGDWGRDTFVSLPGLTLVTGRYEAARSILRSFSAYLSEGMMPNRFPDSGDPPAYNTVDAALWFIYALGKYGSYTGDGDFLRELFPVVAEILDRYEHGTRYEIHLDHDGLLRAGEPGTQLTWMDAKIGHRVVTPRLGKPVEVQALWHHALQFGEQTAAQLGRSRLADHYAALMRRAQASFAGAFWNPAAGCCHDVIAPDGTPDPSIRPNQALVAALAEPLLPRPKRRQLLDTVTRELLTPMGLRTLSPRDPAYTGRYRGDPPSRDAAYHQGTVWPWLLGPYVTAYVKAHGSTPHARRVARSRLAPLFDHLEQAGLGHISELADGDQPHTPGGCIAQAWSLAEPLRALCEDLQTSPGAPPPGSDTP